MKFSELKIQPWITKALEANKLIEATEVQEKAIPLLLERKDVIVRSKTGSGKTFAFLVPILNTLREEKRLQAIVLAPTRELVVQIYKELMKLSRQVKAVEIYGGVSMMPQEEKLRHGAQIAIATPGRLLDHIQHNTINMSTVDYVVLDEADRMLDMGFIDDVERIIKETPKTRQTVMFSATMPPEILHIAKRHMNNPENLMLQQDEITVNKIRQVCLGVERNNKLKELQRILKDHATKTIIFCNTKDWADRLCVLLRKRNLRAEAIHSKLSQNRRNQVIELFNAGRFDILVATDVAARGLHINNVTHVINYDVPRNPKDYVHRIGRTGRAGQEGDAITFVTQMDAPLLKNIEREIKMYLHVQGSTGQVHTDPKHEPTQRKENTESSGSGDDWGLD